VAKFGPVAASVFLALCSFSLAGESAAGADPTKDGNRIGINLWFLSDWDGSFAFVDAMKHALNHPAICRDLRFSHVYHPSYMGR